MASHAARKRLHATVSRREHDAESGWRGAEHDNMCICDYLVRQPSSCCMAL